MKLPRALLGSSIIDSLLATARKPNGNMPVAAANIIPTIFFRGATKRIMPEPTGPAPAILAKQVRFLTRRRPVFITASCTLKRNSIRRAVNRIIKPPTAECAWSGATSPTSGRGNPSTTISFSLPATEHVTLRIYDALGREVATLVNSRRQAGSHLVKWDGKDDVGQPASSGFYLIRLTAGVYSWTRRMLLLR